MSKVKRTVLFVLVTSLLFGASVGIAGTVELARTGQTNCYSATGKQINCGGTGQDGAWLAGKPWPAPRLVDNLDGTVTDTLTGLMWLQDANCFQTNRTWEDALATVADFNINSGTHACENYTANYSDWVVPNVNELESLDNADESARHAWLESVGFLNVEAGTYWTSTTWDKDSGRAWTSIVGHGIVRNNQKSEFAFAWPVRTAGTGAVALWRTGQTTIYATGDDGDLQKGASWPSPRFQDNGDGTLTDNLTGLMWLQDAYCFERQNWQGALDLVADFNADSDSYGCENYTADHSDWRLPNRRAWRSLIDYSQSGPALPADHLFVNMLVERYWTSTSFLYPSPDNAFTLNNDAGWLDGTEKDGHLFIALVRGGETDPVPPVPGWPQVYSPLLADRGELELLRRYRDEVLVKNEVGRSLVGILYAHSTEAAKILLTTPHLLRQARALIRANKDGIARVLNGDQAVLQDVGGITAFLERFSAKATPGLKRIAQTAKRRLRRSKERYRPFLGFRLQ